MNCEFSNPVNLLGEPAEILKDPWNFKNMVCNEDPKFELIQNTETGAEFYVNKTLSYGELLIVIFLSIFLIFSIIKFLWNFIFQEVKAKL